MMTLLQIVGEACVRLSIYPKPTSVVANTTQQIQELLSMAQTEGKELSKVGTWKALRTEKTFTATAAAVQASAIPTDFDWMVPETMFNRTLRRKVNGPIDAADWQLIQSALVNRIFPMFRFRGSDLLITPTPAAGDTIAYEYMSKNWCTTSTGTGQSLWAADTDIPVLQDELMVQGIRWRFLQLRGMDYADLYGKYTTNVKQALTREGSRRRIDTGVVKMTEDRIQGDYVVVPL